MKWLELHGRISVDIKAIYEEVKYECNSCNSLFTDKVKIKGHIWEMHEGVMYDCNHYDSKLLSRLFLDNTSYLYIKEWSITVPHVTIVLLSRVILHNMYSHTMNNFSNIKAKKPHRIVSGETDKLNISILFKKTWKSVLLLGVYIKK